MRGAERRWGRVWGGGEFADAESATAIYRVCVSAVGSANLPTFRTFQAYVSSGYFRGRSEPGSAGWPRWEFEYSPQVIRQDSAVAAIREIRAMIAGASNNARGAKMRAGKAAKRQPPFIAIGCSSSPGVDPTCIAAAEMPHEAR